MGRIAAEVSLSNFSACETAALHIRAGHPDEAERLLRANLSNRNCAAALRDLLVGERRMPEAAQIANSLAAGLDLEALVSAALLRHLNNDFPAAVRLCQQALQIDPKHTAALNHLGRALHNLGRANDARAMFERALLTAPGDSASLQNLAFALRASGDLEAARQAFESALESAPGSRAARLQLGITLYTLERAADALTCFETLLTQAPDEVEALIGAGLSLHLLGRQAQARARYDHALKLAPEHATAHYYLGCLLNESMDSTGAIAALTRALQLQPNDVDAWTELAGVYEQSSRIDLASDAVARGLRLNPQHPALNLEAAKLERRRGDTAIAVARLKRIDPRQLQSRITQQYWFELGHALDRIDEHAGAMQALETANALAARSVRRQAIDPGAFDRLLDRIASWTARGAPGALPQPGDGSEDRGGDLCFLVGMPRSGTTLLDTMLAAHPDVLSIEEQPTLEHAIADLATYAAGYPDALEDLDGAQIRALRQRYRQAQSRHLGGRSAPLIVDKLHLRCIHVGLIQRLFPDARMLFVLRHPGDVVLSNFMQQYAPNDAFVHFDTLASSARIYARVLSLWRASQPCLQLRREIMRYEVLVADTAGELARICEFLGIAPNAAMLDREARGATRERVRTNSYQQVAEPIYQRSSGRWQRYRRWLEPQFALLQPHAEALGYSFD